MLAKLNGQKIIESNISKFDWPLITPIIEETVINQLNTSISIYNKSGIFDEFEQKFAKYHSTKFALLFNSGTSAIHGMIEGLNLEPGAEIVCPAYTFFATCSPAAYLGYKLVFCDCDENGNIDPKEIEKKINSKTKVILITHMWGNACQMDEIVELKQAHNLFLLEDCSHAHGAEYKGKKLGTFGDAAAWSLQGQKIITGGEGGILITNNEDIYYRATLLGHYNKRCKDIIPKGSNLYQYATTGFGLKLRAHPLAIAIANEQFEHLDNWITQKNIFANRIIDALSNIPFLSFINTADSISSYYGLIIKYDAYKANKISREVFVELLQSEGLSEVDIPNSTSPLYNLPFFMHANESSKRLSSYTDLILSQKEFEKAIQFYNSIIKIPIWVRPQDESIIDKYIEGFVKVSQAILENSNQIKLAHHITNQEKRLKEDKIEKVVVGAIVTANQKILVLKRQSNDFMGDLVELPSGGVEPGETIFNSLTREIQEEAGIDIQGENIEYVNTFDYISGSGKRARQLNFVILLVDQPEIKINLVEHSEYFWLGLDELNNYNISEETKKSIIQALTSV